MPLVVTAMFSAETNAAFYLAYMIANGCQLMAGGSTHTLYAAAVRSPQNLTHQMRLTLMLSFGTVVPAILALMVFGSTIMGFFGSTYAASASSLLPALAALALPLVIRDHWIALARIRRQTQRGARIIALSAGLEMLGAIGGGLVGGLAGLSVGWLLALTVAAVAMAPTVLRAATRLPAVNTPPSRSIAGSE
jgi:O-antigen/teichoic acid export membrane protein